MICVIVHMHTVCEKTLTQPGLVGIWRLILGMEVDCYGNHILDIMIQHAQSLELSVREVYHYRFLNDGASGFDECLVAWICLDVVVPILESLEFDDEGILDTILQEKVRFHGGESCVWIPYLQTLWGVIFPPRKRFDVRLLVLWVNTSVFQGNHSSVGLLYHQYSRLSAIRSRKLASWTASGVASPLNWN